MAAQRHDTDTTRYILRDAFGRVRELVSEICDGLTLEQSTYRPAENANPIGWLIWHLTRIQDDHLCGLSGEPQVWTDEEWYDRCDRPYEPAAHGFGQSSDEVSRLQVEPELLDGYHAAVHARTLAYVDRVDAAELARVVDEDWDPPVTAGVRLVSILGDCLQHAGQAAYVKGLRQDGRRRSTP